MTSEHSDLQLQIPTLMLPASAAECNYLTAFEDHTNTYGDRVPINWGGVPGILLGDPYDVNLILKEDTPDSDQKRTVKGLPYTIVSELLGPGTVSADEDWRLRHGLIASSLRGPQVTAMVDELARVGNDYMDDLQARIGEGSEVDLKQVTATLTFKALSAVLLRDHAPDALAGITYKDTIENTFNLLKRNVGDRPPEVVEDIRQTRERLQALSMLAIDNARAKDPDRTMVSKLAHATFGAELTDEQRDTIIRDELTNLLFAGYETTALTLTWMLKILQDHPEVAGRMREEIQTVLGGEPPTAETLPRLTYVHQVLYEVLRLRPPTPVFARWTIDKVPLGDDGFAVEPNQLVVGYIYGVHHNRKYWPHPEVFDPERFSPENSKGRPRELYIPFAAGLRRCTGERLAMTEAAIFASMLVERFNVYTVPNETAPYMNLTLNPETTSAYMEPRPTA